MKLKCLFLCTFIFVDLFGMESNEGSVGALPMLAHLEDNSENLEGTDRAYSLPSENTKITNNTLNLSGAQFYLVNKNLNQDTTYIQRFGHSLSNGVERGFEQAIALLIVQGLTEGVKYLANYSNDSFSISEQQAQQLAQNLELLKANESLLNRLKELLVNCADSDCDTARKLYGEATGLQAEYTHQFMQNQKNIHQPSKTNKVS